MKDEFYEEFSKNYNETNDTLLAMNTYLKRHNILIEKIVDNYSLSPEMLEELGEFLTDWGNCLTKYGELRKEECNFVLKLLEEID
jgi:hypothetical protein